MPKKTKKQTTRAPSQQRYVHHDFERRRIASLSPFLSSNPHKQARQRINPAVVPAMEKNKPYRPPFWQSKVYGEPYGDFNRQPKPQAVVRVNGGDKPAAGGEAGKAGGGGLNLRRPTSARIPATKAAAATAASRPKSAVAAKRQGQVGRPTQRGDGVVAEAAYNHNLAIGGKLQDLEDKMRSRLRQARSLHAGEKAVLLGAFHGVDKQRTGKVNPEQFIKAWGRLQVAVSPEEAMAAFNKYGQTRDGLLPYPVFAEALLVGRNRLVGMSSDMRKGAFVAGKNAEFQGKIMYPPCRKGVFTPSGWDGAAAKRQGCLSYLFTPHLSLNSYSNTFYRSITN